MLVTGGAGFIGSHIVDVLLGGGAGVTVLDNLYSGSKENLKAHLNNPKFAFVEGDIRDKSTVIKAMKDADAVVHAAAIVSVSFSIKNPDLTHSVNAEGTANVLQLALDEGVKRFVFSSSCALYGDQKKLPISEDAPLEPLSPYASSKLAAEQSCMKFCREKGLETVVLRYFNVYGPRQSGGDYAGVMVNFKERVLQDKNPVIYGDGGQTRDFINVRDVARATELALGKKVAGEVVNIGTGKAISIKSLCELFIKSSGRIGLEPTYEPAKPGEVRHSQADTRKARKLLTFEPVVAIEDGVRALLCL